MREVEGKEAGNLYEIIISEVMNKKKIVSIFNKVTMLR